MKLRFWMAATSLAAVIVPPAMAQDNSPTSKKEKKICRLQGPDTGSILSKKRVCLTKNEWAALDEANAQNAQAALDARRNASPGR